MKKYAHMAGENINMSLEGFASDRIAIIASNAASEILRGNINIKEKQMKKALVSLTNIAEGNVKQELEEIGGLKEKHYSLKNQIKKLEMSSNNKVEQNKTENIKKEMESLEVKTEKIEEKISEIQRDLEEIVCEIFGYPVELRI